MNTNELDKEYYLLYCATQIELYDSDENGSFVTDCHFDKQPIPDEVQELQFNVYGKEKTIESADMISDGIIYVISEKTHNAIALFDIPTIQMVAAKLMHKAKKQISNNWSYLNMYTNINCLDKSNSECDIDDFDGSVSDISKIVLDSDALSVVPLKERLIFNLGEMDTHRLFHRSVVDAIMATEPTGIRFVKVEDYHTGSAFD